MWSTNAAVQIATIRPVTREEIFAQQQQQIRTNNIFRPEKQLNRTLVNSRLLAKIAASKTKVLNITCPELNNVTFNNNPPFDHLGIPECGDKVLPEMVLYLPGENSSFVPCMLQPDHLPNNMSRQCFEKIRKDKTIWKVVILTHGFTKTFDTPWLHSMQKKIMNLDPGTAVIVSREEGIINPSHSVPPTDRVRR